MADVGFEIGVILMLLSINGYFALAEIAVVSSRRPRLERQARDGDRRAAAALRLAESPARFLSAVQIGITVVGTLSGAYGGATLARPLAAWLAMFPAMLPYSDAVAVGVVVVLISFFAVIIGELVPKRVGLSHPERFARVVSGPMTALAGLVGPLVTVLERTSDVLLRVFRLPQGRDSEVTEADVSAMLEAGTVSGVFDTAERHMVERVFRLDDEPVAAIMTPRRDIVWLNANDTLEANLDVVREHPYSRFPVCEESLDRTLGVVAIRDIWAAGAAADLRTLIRQPLVVPDTAVALDVLKQFHAGAAHIALVVDEHGGVDGLLTLNNLLLFIANPPGTPAANAEGAAIVQRDPSSWLVDGGVSLGDFYAAIGMPDPASDTARPYHTVAGLVMAELGRVPAAGDMFTTGPLRLEVVDMDGFRVDKVIATRLPPGSP